MICEGDCEMNSFDLRLVVIPQRRNGLPALLEFLRLISEYV